MDFDILYKAIGMLDPEIIEAAEKAPRRIAPAKVAKPWLKWAVTAVVIAVFAIGTPIALNMMGAFKNDNYVSPDNSGGSNNSGIIMPIDSSEPESSSEQTSEDASASKDSGSSSHGSETMSSRSVQLGSSSAETPDNSGTETPGTDSSEPDSSSSFDIENSGGSGGGPLSIGSRFGGSFHKKNMPAVTYRINGEYKSFDYDNSAWIIIDAEADLDGIEGVYIVDYYTNKDGSRAVAYDGSEELMEYSCRYNGADSGDEISVEEVVGAAKHMLLNTDIPFNELENLNAASVASDKKSFEIVMTFTGGEVELLLNKDGSLKHFIVYKDASTGLSPDRIAAGREKLNAKLEKLRTERPNDRFVLSGEYFEKLGNKIYVIFDVYDYPDPNSDTYGLCKFYCVI